MDVPNESLTKFRNKRKTGFISLIGLGCRFKSKIGIALFSSHIFQYFVMNFCFPDLAFSSGNEAEIEHFHLKQDPVEAAFPLPIHVFARPRR